MTNQSGTDQNSEMEFEEGNRLLDEQEEDLAPPSQNAATSGETGPVTVDPHSSLASEPNAVPVPPISTHKSAQHAAAATGDNTHKKPVKRESS